MIFKKFIIYFVNVTFNLANDFRDFIILTKFWQSFLYIETLSKILSRLKKLAKNHNNQTQ